MIYRNIAAISYAVPSDIPDRNIIIKTAIEEIIDAERHDAIDGHICFLCGNQSYVPLDLSFKKNMLDARAHRRIRSDKIPRMGVVR